MIHIKLFEQFKGNYRYKLVANTEFEILKALKWFSSNFDITNGFINAVANEMSGYNNGTLIKIELVEDHMPQFIEKTQKGYEIEIALFNYDGKILSMDEKWNLDFIHKYMKEDNIDCEIVEVDDKLKESNTYGTSGAEAPYWTMDIDGKEITITTEDVQKYLDENNIPTVEIPVKDIFHLCAHRNKTDKKTLERSERSSLKFPIIVAKIGGKYTMVLDGHHRLLKAENNNIDKIKARVIELSKAPDEYKKMFV